MNGEPVSNDLHERGALALLIDNKDIIEITSFLFGGGQGNDRFVGGFVPVQCGSKRVFSDSLALNS